MHAFQQGPASPPARSGPTAIQLNIPDKTPDEVERRGSATVRPVGHRRTSGGLSGQYSTSMPSSGGYFPEDAAEDLDDESASRRRAREDKRRALKAAWGIDTRTCETRKAPLFLLC